MARRLRFTANETADMILTMLLPLDGSDDSLESSDSEEEFVADLFGLENQVGIVAESHSAYREPTRSKLPVDELDDDKLTDDEIVRQKLKFLKRIVLVNTQKTTMKRK